MAFDYQSLKNINGAAIIDGSLNTADFANTTITANKFATGAVTAAKFGSSAVDVSTGTVTGTLPIAKGGLNLTGFGGAY